MMGRSSLPKPSRRLASTSMRAVDASDTADFQDDLRKLKGTSRDVVTNFDSDVTSFSEDEESAESATWPVLGGLGGLGGRCQPLATFPFPLPLPLLLRSDGSEAQDLKPPAQPSEDTLQELSLRSFWGVSCPCTFPKRLQRLADGAGTAAGAAKRRLLGGG